MISISRLSHSKLEDFFFLYDSKFFKHPWKLKTHFLGTYLIADITDVGTMKFQELDGTYVTGMVNGSFLKPYHDGHDIPG